MILCCFGGIEWIGEEILNWKVHKDYLELEMKYKRSEEKYKSLKKYNPNGVISFDLNGKLIGVNPAIERITKYSQDEFQFLKLNDWFEEEDAKVLIEIERKVVYTKKPSEAIEMKIKTKYGDTVFSKVRFIPIIIEDVMEGYFLIVEDITRDKHTEEMLLKSEKLNIVGQLAASIVHEIRNPLTSLMGFLQLMKHNQEINEQFYQIMMDEMMRINSIANELLVLAKRREAKVKPADLVSNLTDIVQLMNSQAIIQGVEIVMITESPIENIECDIQQLKQVFINILKNGLEAMEGRKGVITVQVKELNEDYILLSFADQGVGLSPDQLKNLGEPFFTTKEKGTGLGMLMTYNIIHNHNGKLEVESEVGQGTVIKISLPKKANGITTLKQTGMGHV